MVSRLSERAKDNGKPRKVSAPARFPASVQALQKKRPLLEVLQEDVSLENWSPEEREEFESRFNRRFRRSFWSKDREQPRHWQFYCPLCGCTRRLGQAPTPWTSLNLARVGVTTGIVMLGLWPWLDWKGIVAFVPLWVIFETVFRVRTRAQLVCDQCGFDPTLYMTDVARARREVEDFWKEKLAREERHAPTQKQAAGRGLPAEMPEDRGDENSFEDPLQQGETLLDSR